MAKSRNLVSIETLNEQLSHVLAAPKDEGSLVMIVRRPAVDEREILRTAELSFAEGVVGDSWNQRSSKRTEDGSPHLEMQLNVISSRVAHLLATDATHAADAGDQLFLDMDITEANMPPGTRLSIGDAVVEITSEPHRGCAKFSARFGADARRWVNAGDREGLRLRGANAKVVTEGTISANSRVAKL